MTTPQWPMPAKTTREDDSPRHVGVEFELQGIAVDDLAKLTATTLNGQLELLSTVEYKVTVPEQGDYRVEVDYALLKQKAKQQQDLSLEEQKLIDTVTVDVLSAASSLLVPCEVITPPLEMESLAQPMQALTDAIRAAGGKGTRHSLFYAFGLHLNIEPPALDAHTVAAYMKAFTCLFDWLVWEGEVDPARRATPYIQRFPEEYALHLTDPEYWPDWDTLIDDYLHWNASRNRALDMLPLFAEIDAARVHATVDDAKVKARPAFHYRLANCEIDEPDWSIVDPWSRWLQIEYLANDRNALLGCCAAYRSDRKRLLHRVDNSWRQTVTQWLQT